MKAVRDPYPEVPVPVRLRPSGWHAADEPPSSYERPREAVARASNGSIITGILMMVGAVVWFVAGLAGDVIFFYPPVMFVLGFIALVKGLMRTE